jgi:hypothetical protein
MKFLNIPLLLSLAISSVTVAVQGLTYTPNNDVNDHSKIALDQLDISDAIDVFNTALALDIYTNGKNRAGKSIQEMATKDWAAAGLEDVADYDAFAALFYQEGEPFLDTYNLDAMNCNGTFSGQSQEMCDIAAKKNLICTGLLYAQYEAVNSIQYKNEKNWDELFAFWNGVYDETVDSRVNSGGAGAVQKSRDADFGTSFLDASIQAMKNGQKAFSGSSVDTDRVTKAYDDFKRANLATFAQATLKYASLFDEEGLEQAAMDTKWGEGYTYFRCGAGLMHPELALYINYVLDPRDKLGQVFTPKETYCKIVKKMLSLPDIGYGLTLDELNLGNYPSTSTIKEDCGLDSIKHAEGLYYSDGNYRNYVPVLELLVVVCMYFASYIFVTRKRKVE